MKLHLNVNEKALLTANGQVVCVRESSMNEPLSSIIYGEGNGKLFDKVDYKWVFGDVDKYIEDKKNVDRRAEDYPDNSRNVWSGSYWWDCKGEYNDYWEAGKEHRSGTRNLIKYQITSIKIVGTKPVYDGKYIKLIIHYTVSQL